MVYNQDDKIDSLIQEFETAKLYLDECIRVLKLYKYEDMRTKLTSWESHLILDKIHQIYRSVSRFPVINFIKLRDVKKEE